MAITLSESLSSSILGDCDVSVTLSQSSVSINSPVTATITVSCQNSKPLGIIVLSMALHGSGSPVGISLCVKEVRPTDHTATVTCAFSAPLGPGQYDIVTKYIGSMGGTVTGSSVLTVTS